MVDAHGLRMHRKSVLSASTHDTEKARYFEAIEKRAARSSDVVVAVSQSDLDHLRKVSSFVTKSMIIPNVHIKPSVSQSHFSRSEGEIPVFLVGSKPTREVLELSSRNVTVTGWVDDLRPVYDKARIFVAPLRYGAGVKGKIGESLSFGLPTITTSIGAEGMDLEHGVDLFIAETADEIANRICEIYNNEELLASIAKNGSEKIETLFGKTSLRNRLQELVDFISEQDD